MFALPIAATNRQLDLAFATLASLSRHAATATESFVAFSSSSQVPIVTTDGSDPQAALQNSASALGALREDLTHARGLLMELRASCTKPGAQRSAVQMQAAASLSAVEALVQELAGSTQGAQVRLSRHPIC